MTTATPLTAALARVIATAIREEGEAFEAFEASRTQPTGPNPVVFDSDERPRLDAKRAELERALARARRKMAFHLAHPDVSPGGIVRNAKTGLLERRACGFDLWAEKASHIETMIEALA